MRLTKIAGIFHLQIRQAEVGTLSHINQSTIAWKPIEQNSNYARVSMYYTDKMNLDNIVSTNPTNVVTGVRIKLTGDRFHLEARFTQYDFATGNLFSNTSNWSSNYNNAHK